ncbi:MAG: DEAD/DEAH box helicase family protein [Gammaproteobacteria bacterium]|nr:DEAD/DEAH box helicase family protein [Gammaproteobacteria bacterium]
MIEITVLDPVWSQIDKGRSIVKPCLSYHGEVYKQGKFKKIRKEYEASMIHRGGLVLTGLIDRIVKFSKRQDIPIRVLDPDGMLEPLSPTSSIQSTFDIDSPERSYQRELVTKIVQQQRGVIKAATGTGKTVLMVSLISAYRDRRVLFLSNTHIALSQFAETLLDAGLGDVCIDIQTIQSASRGLQSDWYDIVIVDECHEGMDESSMYYKVLTNLAAPIRVGFTATLPPEGKHLLVLEGLLGPVIGEFTIQEGTERGVLSKPQIKMHMLPEHTSLRDYYRYGDVYRLGVVENRALNRKVVTDALEDSKLGPVLILVTQIAHGENVCAMASELYGRKFTFVSGATDAQARDQIRKEMVGNAVVVATAVFRKALNVPALSSVINACGGKSEIQTLQAIGRGLRVSEGKRSVVIRDYFNPSHRFLVDHFGRRLCLYFREGWL